MNFFTDVLSYPFRGGGKYILGIGTALFAISQVASLAPLIGGVANLLLFGYFCATYFKIIESTAVNDREAPDFPEISSMMDDIVWPVLQILAALTLSFGPFVAYVTYAGEDLKELITYLLLGFGVFYAPMAILAMVVLGSAWALSPHIVLPAIYRAGGLYLAAIGLLIGLYMSESLISVLLDDLLILKFLILSVVGMYCMMANGRVLGLIFRQRREELNWI
jgi:hypothetical protein